MTNYEVIAQRLSIAKTEMEQLLKWWKGSHWKDTAITIDGLVEALEAFRSEKKSRRQSRSNRQAD